MSQLINFDDCSSALRFYGGAEKKGAVIYEGEHYLLKYPKPTKIENNLNSSYTNNVFSEYLSCHIIETMDIPVQSTLLGKKNGKIVVACKDFTDYDNKLYEFSKFENSYLETDNSNKHTELTDVIEILNNHERILNREEMTMFFWDMFVTDAFLGNFDRHTGNFGFLVNEKQGTMKAAPIYDCGSCLYPALADDVLTKITASQDEIEKRIYDFPTSALAINKAKINYYDFLMENDYSECNEAIIRIAPKIDFNKIDNVIDCTPVISKERSDFYKTMLRERYSRIIIPAYNRARTIIEAENQVLDFTEEKGKGR